MIVLLIYFYFYEWIMALCLFNTNIHYSQVFIMFLHTHMLKNVGLKEEVPTFELDFKAKIPQIQRNILNLCLNCVWGQNQWQSEGDTGDLKVYSFSGGNII